MTLKELGQAIREKRESVGMSIDDVSARIKISSRILKSIEEGSLVGMPHAVYTKSFARSFGLVVGYDQAELNAALDEVFPPESLDESASEPGILARTRVTDSSGFGRRFAVLLFLLLLFGGLIGGGWYVAKTYGDRIIELVKQPFSAITEPKPQEQRAGLEKPAERSGSERKNGDLSASAGKQTESLSGPGAAISQNNPSPAPAGVAASESGSGQTSPQASGQSLAQPLPAQAPANPALPAGQSAAQTAGQASERTPAADSASPSASGGKNQIQITASQACWVGSRADGARGRGYTVQPGESFVLTYDKSLELTLGNAGGVTITHNGKNLGSPGRAGQRVVINFPE